MKILIIGAGYLGAACAARWRSAGHATCEWTLSDSGDCADPAAWKNFSFAPDAVLFCPSTRGGGAAEYQRTYLLGLQTALRRVPPAAALLFSSSTSVYGQTDGGWVDETSATAPASATAQILLAAERLALNAGGTVLRLAAIYGPGRLAWRDRLLAGAAPAPADARRWLNHIHRDDIVSAATLLLTQKNTAGEVFNVSDGAPASYREIHEWLAAHYHRPLPFSAAEAQPRRGVTNKRVANQKLRALGWRPAYPSFREGYAAAEEGE